MNSFSKGIKAEKQALTFFLNQNYACIAQRFKTAWGEIDLVLEKESQLVFVEVKRRPYLSQGLYSLRFRQCQRIARSALIFLQHYAPKVWECIQIDLVIISENGSIYHIPHIWTMHDEA